MTSPSQKQTERIHPEETRPFTVRENARIQTFPDDWKFVGSMYSQYKQVGNAVPVKLAYFIGNSIKESILKITKFKLRLASKSNLDYNYKCGN